MEAVPPTTVETTPIYPWMRAVMTFKSPTGGGRTATTLLLAGYVEVPNGGLPIQWCVRPDTGPIAGTGNTYARLPYAAPGVGSRDAVTPTKYFRLQDGYP